MRAITVAIVSYFIVVIGLLLYAGLYDLPPCWRTFVDRHGNVIGTIDSSYQGFRIWKPLDEIPKVIIKKTLIVEDRFFFWHRGINPFAIARAVIANARAGRIVRGGSTITQQLAKLLVEEHRGRTSARTLTNKIRETILAMGLELIHSKQWILERYLNTIYYGHSTWGVRAATERYFGKELHELSLGEIDFLVRIPRAPSRVAANLPVYSRLNSPIGRHFMEHVSRFIPRGDGRAQIRTTLDLYLQKNVEEAIRSTLEPRLEGDSLLTAAAVVIDVHSGDVLAMVGSRDYFASEIAGQVNAAVARRQPGSALKPFTYFAAFAKGYTSDSIVPDEPLSFTSLGDEEASAYAPQNFDRRFHGDMTIREALASSYNVPAVAMLNDIGLSFYHDILKKFGFTTFDQPPHYYGLGVTLGAGEVTLLELTNAYAALARGGKYLPYRFGDDQISAIAKPILVNSGVYASDITSILSDEQARLKGFGFNEEMAVEGHLVAVKTGTSWEHRDNWAVGYSPSYAVGVWVGHADGSPMDPFTSTGASAAAPIWHAIMEQLLRGHVAREFPFVSKVRETSLQGNLIALPAMENNHPRGWRVLSPLDNATFRIHEYLPLKHQRIAARARVDTDKQMRFSWYLDGEFIATTGGQRHEIWITPEAGRHRLGVEDASGKRQEILFKVIGAEDA